MNAVQTVSGDTWATVHGAMAHTAAKLPSPGKHKVEASQPEPGQGRGHRGRPVPRGSCNSYKLTMGTDLSSMRPQDLVTGESSQDPYSATEVWEAGCRMGAKRNDRGFSEVLSKGC